MTAQPHRPRFTHAGIGQLSLVEHALCPLDARRGMVEHLVHQAAYHFTDAQRRRRTARARVLCPIGLSANDELYLWGLLALTLRQADHGGQLHATPHWCLRQLRLIDQHAQRGGRQYAQFAAALERLSAITYLNDNFYDPVHREHRRVSFGFLSYSLPIEADSSRAWRIQWDPVFIEMVAAVGGQFRFDLAVYRALDPATRRLFLFACKIFPRRSDLPTMDLQTLAVDVLGFAASLRPRDLKLKLTRCLERLQSLDVVASFEFCRVGPGDYRLRAVRGAYFEERRRTAAVFDPTDNPAWDPLIELGFDAAAARRLLKRYPQRLISEWIDITQAARERFGARFFRKSPMAYLVDSLGKAASGTRTAPDWWREVSRERSAADFATTSADVLSRIRGEIFGEAAAPEADPRSNAGFFAIGSVLRGK